MEGSQGMSLSSCRSRRHPLSILRRWLVGKKQMQGSYLRNSISRQGNHYHKRTSLNLVGWSIPYVCWRPIRPIHEVCYRHRNQYKDLELESKGERDRNCMGSKVPASHDVPNKWGRRGLYKTSTVHEGARNRNKSWKTPNGIYECYVRKPSIPRSYPAIS